MNSKLRELLGKDYLTDVYGRITHFVMVDGDLNSKLDAEKAIRQAVGEEMLGLKPGVVLAEPLASDKEWAEYEGYNKALDDWGQKIKQWQGGES